MDELAVNIITLTRKIRNDAYEMMEKRVDCDNIPFGGSIRESIGPFPEFILKGRYCNRSQIGLCTPCFYSRLPKCEVSFEEYNESYEKQVQFIVDNFQEKVISNEKGKVAHTFFSQIPIYGIVCTPTGSYFDENEYPLNVRINNLRRLVTVAKQYSCELVLHIESHAEDVIKYFSDLKQEKKEEEIELLRQLHTRVLLGFESVNDFSRNVLYSKNLSLKDFEKAIIFLKENGFATGAFVFAGLIAMTEEETKKDVHDSLVYLKEKDVSPVLMFANTQEYTIPDVLLVNNEHKLLDPRTVYEIIEDTLDIFGCSMEKMIDPWFIADPVGGPPEPNYHIFNASTSTVCNECSKIIYNAIEQLRITKDGKTFNNTLKSVKKCSCFREYENMMKDQEKISKSHSLRERAEEKIAFAKSQVEYYKLQKNPWLIKAELLCYGLHITDTQKEIIFKTNPYIYEKGFINASHIKYRDVLINVCIADEFCNNSPYSLLERNNKWQLVKDGYQLGEINFLDYPEWLFEKIDDINIGDVLRPHSDSCISLWPSTKCSYMEQGIGCKFCCLLPQKGRILPVDTVVNMVSKALYYNPSYEINLSGGTCGNPRQAVDYLCQIAEGISSRFDSTAISVECAPPSEIEDLTRLKRAGVSAIVMNLEIYDSDLRKIICPGKSNISRERYFEVLKKSVEIFGEGNVSSVLIVGIQPNKDILKGAQELINLGVIPTLIPIKPLESSQFNKQSIVDPNDYISLSKEVALMMQKRKLFIRGNTGCAACGACSLEIDLRGKRL